MTYSNFQDMNASRYQTGNCSLTRPRRKKPPHLLSGAINQSHNRQLTCHEAHTSAFASTSTPTSNTLRDTKRAVTSKKLYCLVILSIYSCVQLGLHVSHCEPALLFVSATSRSDASDWLPAELADNLHLTRDASGDGQFARQLAAESLVLQSTSNQPRVETEEGFFIRKGANGTLTCLPVSSGDRGAAMNKIEWFKEDKKLAEVEEKRVIVWNTKNSIAYLPETGALFFRGVSNEDSGEYHCVMTRQSSGLSEDGIVRFYVQDVPDPPGMPIIMAFTSRSVNISWIPSHDNHNSPILHYIVHVREGVDGKWDVSNGVQTPDNRTQYEIIGLKPFTTYSFRVLAVNAIGVSEPSQASHYIITLRQKPDSKLVITSARNVSSSAIKLEWLPPSANEIHGEFLGYKIRYVHQNREPATGEAANSGGATSGGRRFGAQPSRVEQPRLDGPLAREIQAPADQSLTSYVVKGLNTFTLYKFSVQVSNLAGDGPVAEALAMTDEGVPSPPVELSVIKATDTTVKLRWSEPKSPNGILQGYQINLFDVGTQTNDTRKLSDPQSTMEHTIGELLPFTWYKVSIQAYSRKFMGEPSQVVRFRTDVSAPSPPQAVNVTCVSPDSLHIQWQRPEKFYANIDFYYLHYKRDSARQYDEMAFAAQRDKLVNELIVSNLTADLLYELKLVAATKSTQDSQLVYRSEPSATLRVVLQENCESYTAYPLTENTFNLSLAIGVVCASFALALVTASLIVWRRHCQAAYYYLDEPQSASRGTNSPQLSETYNDSEYGSTPVNDWAKHVQKLHADGDIGFSRDFESIQAANQNSQFTYEHSQLLDNKHKNRYINIVAYDHTRVVLRSVAHSKKSSSDYINANYIDGYNKQRAYIGTQGPLVSTFDDYWRMIWEQRVVIIVMITNLQERGRRKCDMYWPKEGTETYGHVQVKLLQEVVMATYTLRTFTAKNLKLKKRGDAERTVYQYHYTNWPDHGVPDHPLPVLSFIRKSASANPPAAGPIICHCSAGCGRSGTYIVIDAMLKQIRHRRSINVVDFLKHIRSQRNYLVQTEEQYVFIHDALVEAIESGETEIASNFIAKYIQLLQTGGSATLAGARTGNQLTVSAASTKNSNYSITEAASLTVAAADTTADNQQLLVAPTGKGSSGAPGSGTASRSQSSSGQWSLLERQYRLVASFKAKDFNVVSALKPCNKNKNRTLNLIPLEAHRVHITPKPGVEGSDYINATFLMGFNHLREFILTQHPVYDTFSDFWQMIYDHNAQTIVLLTPSQEDVNATTNASANNNNHKEFPQFWPQKEDEVDYGSFKVKLTQETTVMASGTGSGGAQARVVVRDFIMRSNQDDYELQTKLVHCPGWPECCSPLLGVFDLIQIVQNATQKLASQQRLHDGHSTSTTVTIGQEHEPQNGGPIIVVDKFGGTEAATFAVLTTLYKQINFEDAVDVYMYAKLAHLRRPGIWSSQDDYLFLYRAIESYASKMSEMTTTSNQHQLAISSPSKSIANLYHQTMTLDRHKLKSQSSSSSRMSTSTMRRPTKAEGGLASESALGARLTGNGSIAIESLYGIATTPITTATATTTTTSTAGRGATTTTNTSHALGHLHNQHKSIAHNARPQAQVQPQPQMHQQHPHVGAQQINQQVQKMVQNGQITFGLKEPSTNLQASLVLQQQRNAVNNQLQQQLKSMQSNGANPYGALGGNVGSGQEHQQGQGQQRNVGAQPASYLYPMS